MAKKMDAFTRAYFEAALWSTTDESDEQGGEPLDKNYSISDFADDTRDKMISDCADFQERFGELISDDDSPKIEQYGRDEIAGHDFWLTRNGHGAGFWDGDWPNHGDELTNASKEYGEFYLYVGDDGEIHGPPEGAYGVREGRRVADFNSLDDLIAHAGSEGATHALVAGANSQIFYPRGGQYPYEAATVWRKSGYWHAQGPGARTGVTRLPNGAKPIGGHSRRAAAPRVARAPRSAHHHLPRRIR